MKPIIEKKRAGTGNLPKEAIFENALSGNTDSKLSGFDANKTLSCISQFYP